MMQTECEQNHSHIGFILRFVEYAENALDEPGVFPG